MKLSPSILLFCKISYFFSCAWAWISNNSPDLLGKRTEVLQKNKYGFDEDRKELPRKELSVFVKVISALLKDFREDLKLSTFMEERCRERLLRSTGDGSDLGLVIVEPEADNEVSVTSLLYKETEPWSVCRRSCRTSRIRKCRIKNLCEVDIFVEEAYCYVPGSKCEKRIQNMFNESKVTPGKEVEEKENDYTEDNEDEKGMDEQYYSYDYKKNKNEYDYEIETTTEIYNREPPNDYYDFTDYYYSDYDYTNTNNNPNINPSHSDHNKKLFLELFSNILGLSNLEPDEFSFDCICEEGCNCGEAEKGKGISKEERDDSHRETWGKATPDVAVGRNDCGKSDISAPYQMFRIIGGREAIKNSWPWQVAILNRFKEVFCGGTLIASRWVVTAAHCVRKKLYVRVGEHDLSLPDGEIELRVEKSFKHPYFDVETIDSDIALLKLPKGVLKDDGSHLPVACLPSFGDPLPRHQSCIVLGWGKERESHIFGSDVLRYVKVPIVGRKTCERAYTNPQITDNMFCAGVLRGGMDACEGDSGGPLLCQNENKRWVLQGVTSFGEGCGEKNMLGVYVRVANYEQWIQETMRLN